nr:MAG TPA: RecT protein [Caudoviricetes sp.]
MNATTRLTPPAKTQTFSNAITSNAMQELIRKSLKDPKAVARFTSTLIQAVNSSDQLKECDPGSVVAAALRGEGMGLILNIHYHLVPFGRMCNFIISYKGYIALALATKQYHDIDCLDIREGEYMGRDSRTGKPNFDFNVYSTDEEREAAQVIGYYAYFELKDGMFRPEFWSMNKLLFHADRYSQAFDLEKFKKFTSGEMTKEEEEKMRKSSPWNDVGYGQDKMCRKTVLRSLLNSGYAPLSNEIRYAMESDSEDGVIPEIPIINVDKSTGEVTGAVPTTPAITAASDDDFFDEAAVSAELDRRNDAKQEEVQTPAPVKRKKAATESKPEEVATSYTDDGFFGGGE